jgi:Trp operon repressor
MPLSLSVQTVFPREIDIADDVFILVERKESMEKFLENVVATMDFLIYKPLFYFLNSNDEIRPLIKKIQIIQATIRMFLIQRKMNQILLKKYQTDLQKFLKLLKNGIRVMMLSTETQQFEPIKKVLWLCHHSTEPGLTRLCCTSSAEFFSYTSMGDEDGDDEMEMKRKRSTTQHSFSELELESDSDDDMRGGKYDGIYLSDIAEVRKGPSSYTFGEYLRKQSMTSTSPLVEKPTNMTDRTDSPDEDGDDYIYNKMELIDNDCVVIVGSERDFHIQFLPESFQDLFDVTGEDEDDEEMLRHYARDWFVDTLTLLSIQSLGIEECSLRNRIWTKCLSEEMQPQHRHALSRKKLGTKRILEAAIFRDVMVGSIQVDEEICDRKMLLRRSPSQFTIEPKVMWYDTGTRRVYIQSLDEGDDHEPVSLRVRVRLDYILLTF